MGALMYATNNDVPGVYNVAGDGNMPWSEVCTLVGKPPPPALALAHQHRVGAAPAAAPLGPAARSAPTPALRPFARQHALPAGRLPLPVLQRGHGRGVRARPAPGEDHRRQAPDLPLRARGRRLLPPFAGRGAARLMEHLPRRASRRCRGRDTRRPRTAQRDDGDDGRGDRRHVRRARGRRVGRRGRDHGRAARVLLGCRRGRARRALERAVRRRSPLDHVDLRRVPARAAVAVADRRRGERPGGRRGHEPRARVPRSHRGARRRGSTRGSCASGCIPAAATRGCSTARSARRPRLRWCCSARGSTGARAAEVGLAWACHPDDELLDARDRVRGRRRAGAARAERGRRRDACARRRGSPTSTRPSPPRSRARPGRSARVGFAPDRPVDPASGPSQLRWSAGGRSFFR